MRKKQFNEVLIARAKEQQKLSKSTLLPMWSGPWTRLIAFHALPSILLVSFVISLIVFSIFFNIFIS